MNVATYQCSRAALFCCDPELEGVFIELMNDALPLGADGGMVGLAMLSDLRIAALLKGYRGRAPIDARAVAQLLSQLSHLMVTYEDIAEVDLNPVILGRAGAATADVRIVLTQSRCSVFALT